MSNVRSVKWMCSVVLLQVTLDFKEKLSQCTLMHQKKKGRELSKSGTWQEWHGEQFKSFWVVLGTRSPTQQRHTNSVNILSQNIMFFADINKYMENTLIKG